MNKQLLVLITTLSILGCSPEVMEGDFLIKGGTIIDGTGEQAYVADLLIAGDSIVFIGQSSEHRVKAQRTIEASGQIVSPGFIDPHTHSLGDLKGGANNSNLNYLTQGVTTVFNGNDGEGPFKVKELTDLLMQNGIGTNTAFLVGHNTVRQEVVGSEDVNPNPDQLTAMKALVRQGMEEGAFGFSTGLYYAPGSYANTDEVIELAKEVAPYNGLYDSHIRDESTYNIGLIEAVKETIEIGEKAGVPVHFAHIKALGVDVWGKSTEVINLIEAAQNRGVRVTADQYPWRASGTHLENAVISRWVMAGGDEAYYKRLSNASLLPRIRREIKENIRKRGGAEALLITADVKDESLIGKNLDEIAKEMNLSPVEATLKIARSGGARVASFNMSPDDLERFMTRPWVMTSSDGTKGHPRKYASFPKKYQTYVIEKGLLSIESFVHKSSGQVAKTFGLDKRGELKEGSFADIIIFNPKEYSPVADFSNPAEYSKGVTHVWVNGRLTINESDYNRTLNGKVLTKK